MKPRVVLLTTGLEPGGAETQVAQLACGLPRLGWAPAVVSLLPPRAFERELAEAGVPVFSLGMRRGAADPRGLARLALILRRLRPWVLHSHMFHANVMARVARLFCPAPVLISTLHSAAESGASGGVRVRDSAYRVTDCLSDAVVAVSEAAAERHAAAGAVRRGKLRVIRNGVDLARFRPDPERRARARAELGVGDAFVWLAAGRLIWKKDFATLLEAFAHVGSGVLLIAGDGPQEADLKAMGSGARFLGRREDMPALMNAADAFVLSSVVEGLPLVLLEAAASGLPAAATDAGGVREAVADGETGFVTPAGDAAALAAAMSRLAALPEAARERMGQAARAAAGTRFDCNRIAAEWERLYRELLPWM
jgi:glycosyltransferase involved in cell wall biosynthesis